jgi:WD40 repeat protein
MFATAGGGADPAADEITLWATENAQRVATFATFKGVVASLAFSPDGKLVAAGGVDGRIALLDADTGSERIAFTGQRGRVTCLSFTFDGKQLAAVVCSDGDPEDTEVCRWDVTRGVPREKFQAAGAVPQLALSPEGALLASPALGEPSGIRILDVETKAQRMLSRVGVNRGDSLIFSPDGKTLAAMHYEDWSPLPNTCPYLYVVDAQTGKIRLRSPRPFDARRGLALSHDGKLLARGIDQGFQLWDLKSLEVRATVSDAPLETGGANLLVFSPDDRTLVSTDGAGLLLLWDIHRILEPR